MRIRSDERDYYDVGASWDSEPTPLFVRVGRTTSLRLNLGSWRVEDGDDPAAEALLARCDREARHLSEWRSAKAVILGFAGRCTAGIVARGRAVWCDGPRYLEDLERLMTDVGETLDRYELGMLEACATRIQDAATEPYRELDAPIFLVRSPAYNRCIVQRNPLLRTIFAESLYDPYRAWQALDQFIGNDLAKQVDPPNPIDDALRRDIHGFDAASFKRDKGGPTRKRGR